MANLIVQGETTRVGPAGSQEQLAGLGHRVVVVEEAVRADTTSTAHIKANLIDSNMIIDHKNESHTLLSVITSLRILFAIQDDQTMSLLQYNPPFPPNRQPPNLNQSTQHQIAI